MQRIGGLPSRLAKNSVDVIFNLEVIEYLDDGYLIDTIEEVKRLLKLSGKLVLTVPNDEVLEENRNFCPDCGCVYHKWQHVRSFNHAAIERLMVKHGFTTIAMEETHFEEFDGCVIKYRAKKVARKILKGNSKKPLLIYRRIKKMIIVVREIMF